MGFSNHVLHIHIFRVFIATQELMQKKNGLHSTQNSFLKLDINTFVVLKKKIIKVLVLEN